MIVTISIQSVRVSVDPLFFSLLLQGHGGARVRARRRPPARAWALSTHRILNLVYWYARGRHNAACSIREQPLLTAAVADRPWTPTECVVRASCSSPIARALTNFQLLFLEACQAHWTHLNIIHTANARVSSSTTVQRRLEQSNTQQHQ